MLKRIFASVYDFGMKRKEHLYLSTVRKKLLWKLWWKILELGSGTWANFSFYASNAEVIALEPSPYMVNASLKKIGEKNITVVGHTLNWAEKKWLVVEWTYDHVVCTLVLCSVLDIEQTIADLYRMLKPGWTLIVIEHVLSCSSFFSWLQKLFTPLQSWCADGCCLDRPTDILLQKSSFVCQEDAYFGSRKTWYRWVFIRF